MSKRRVLGSSLSALMRRPRLATESVRALMSLGRPGRPWPSREYLDWRVHTLYGETDAAIDPADLLGYLEWRRRMRQLRKWGPWA